MLYLVNAEMAKGVQGTVWPEPVILLQEEEALLSEMDVTGQAFEDMQEQNIRLMQQLREKDDANFKLMSERIKSNQIHKLLKEEKEELADQVLTLKTQVDAQLQVVRKLEEKEHLLQKSIGTGEKELGLRTQALEMNKCKVSNAFVFSWWSCCLVGVIEGSELSLALQNLILPGFG
ncbi:E3 ubiquitin-protein ligase BRE1A-like [Cyanistes caeruleus]|uniref:E3 ubiquitin-protein ligase BRE1A-like n=1 Tax=Cyanistes caeruleus TaxID=156563 RepID=UPI000CDAB7C4|nr:E3 ubiquitin-protein ligase BRE1A-like [Cyanistes caeruleus]